MDYPPIKLSAAQTTITLRQYYQQLSALRCVCAGSATTGAQNEHDFVSLFLKGCLQMGCAPDKDMGDAYFYDLTPVRATFFF